MKTSETISNLAESLKTFQAKMVTLPKDASGYGYKYTPLDTVVGAIRENLAAAGLSFVQMPSAAPFEYGPDVVALTTRLMHVSGEWLEDTLIIPVPQVGKSNQAQAYGAALTYARRYALTSMLGIVADEDTDAATPQQKPQQHQPQQTQSGVSDSQRKPTDAMMRKLFAAGNALYGDEWETKRKDLVKSVTGGRTDSSAKITFNECKRLIDGIEAKANA